MICNVYFGFYVKRNLILPTSYEVQIQRQKAGVTARGNLRLIVSKTSTIFDTFKYLLLISMLGFQFFRIECLALPT